MPDPRQGRACRRLGRMLPHEPQHSMVPIQLGASSVSAVPVSVQQNDFGAHSHTITMHGTATRPPLPVKMPLPASILLVAAIKRILHRLCVVQPASLSPNKWHRRPFYLCSFPLSFLSPVSLSLLSLSSSSTQPSRLPLSPACALYAGIQPIIDQIDVFNSCCPRHVQTPGKPQNL